MEYEENFNMEWKIFSMEWNKIASTGNGKIIFHSMLNSSGS